MPVSRPRIRFADPGSFAGQVVVEPDQHLQLGQGLVADIDRAQGVGQRAGGIGDDERIPGIGLRAAEVEVGDAAHGQARQVGDPVTGRASDRDGQRPDRGLLVGHDQQRSVPGEFVEQGSQFGFGVGQRGVMQPLAVRVEADRVVGIFADVQAEEHAETAAHPPCRSLVASGHREGIEGRHPRYDETCQLVAVSLSAVPRCHQTRSPPPDHAFDWGR